MNDELEQELFDIIHLWQCEAGCLEKEIAEATSTPRQFLLRGRSIQLTSCIDELSILLRPLPPVSE